MKTALITGAARRIGAEIARTLHANNYHVIIHCNHSIAEANQLAAALNKIRADSARVIQQPLENIDALPKLIAEAAACWNQLDLLVNNASNFFPTSFGQVTAEQWNSLHAVNLQAPFFLSQAAWPWLQKTKGNIVNIADIHAYIPMGNYSAYSIAKAGVVMMTKALAKEMAPNVRVNAIAPGCMMWPEGENELTETQQEKLTAKTYLKRHGSPQDVAQAVLYLANAAYVTGQILNVDGGRSVG